MKKNIESRPIRARLKFRKNKVEYWDCDNCNQLTNALEEDREATGRIPVSVEIGEEVCHD